MTTCTVALCTRGRPELAAEALRALVRAAAVAGDTEVVVVEQDGRGAAALADELGARHIADTGSGVSRARNIVIAEAKGEIVLITDDDCVVPETWVRDHRDLLLDDSQLAGSFGAVEGLPRDPDPDAAALIRRHRMPAAAWEIGHASNMAVRRDVLRAVGGFDERIGPGSGGVPAGEDSDLITRLIAAGYTLASGTGCPVGHAAWRNQDELVRVLRAYERGAGVCIGAALRARRPYARRLLKQRLVILRRRGAARVRRGDAVDAVGLAFGLVRGLAVGLLLPPWPPAGGAA